MAPSDAVRLLESNFGEVVRPAAETTRSLPAELARGGVAGGAAYDARVALTARDGGLLLVSRDRRAATTHAAIGMAVELLAV